MAFFKKYHFSYINKLFKCWNLSYVIKCTLIMQENNVYTFIFYKAQRVFFEDRCKHCILYNLEMFPQVLQICHVVTYHLTDQKGRGQTHYIFQFRPQQLCPEYFLAEVNTLLFFRQTPGELLQRLDLKLSHMPDTVK